jgi:Flp pilus assembly protein TadG
MSVELAVIAPGLILLLLLVAAGGRVVEVQGHIDGAARDAARAASLAQSPAQASQLAQQAALADLGSTSSISWCTGGSVQAQVAGFPGGAVPEGTDVTVTVQCSVDMSPFRLLGFGQTMQFTGSAIAPLDTFTCRDAQGC